jgi:Chitinase class I
LIESSVHSFVILLMRKVLQAEKSMQKFKYSGLFDRVKLAAEFNQRFGKNPRFNAAAEPHLMTLVGFIERNALITDIRWAAYMLATIFWETTSPVEVVVPKTKKGQPVVDKSGKPVLLKQKRWLMTMSPVDEVGRGKGRKYHEPVKVRKVDDGSAFVIEQDGDQFSVSAQGVVKAITKKAAMGTIDGGAAVKAYDDDPGQEQAYFGRGYVQLTWWSNYAKAGVALGKGLDLLFDPELVKQPETAYAIMSHGMRTGQGFANGRTFSQYFVGDQTNYIGARAMVNGSDHAAAIADIAVDFEAVLLAAATPQG